MAVDCVPTRLPNKFSAAMLGITGRAATISFELHPFYFAVVAKRPDGLQRWVTGRTRDQL
jgi:hypothetical protein